MIVAAEFPPAQRPYILFLAAVDSHRLNAAVTRCAPAKSPGHATLKANFKGRHDGRLASVAG